MEFADFHAIQNLIYRYCDYLDRGDFTAMAQLFNRADIYLGATDQPIRSDAAALEAMYRDYVRIYSDGTPRTRHITTNLIVEDQGAEQATAQSYITVLQSTDTLNLQPIIGGRNLDVFRKADGCWYFSERRIENDMWGDLSKHLLRAFGPEAIGG